MSRRCVLLAIAILIFHANIFRCEADDVQVVCDCGFLDSEELTFTCQGAITERFFQEWSQVSPPEGVIYSIWQKSRGSITLVAFYDTFLNDFDTINVRHDGTLVHCRGPNTKDELVDIPQATMNCFSSELPYITALEKLCLGEGHQIKVPERTVIYFLKGSEVYFRSRALRTPANVFILGLCTLSVLEF